ncbi:hypothetical protein L13192_06240 [Pyrenophora tritici-repentis]|nr:hypothetical protein L13192_06240 [Pyrenophora tritici-repentis]
MVPADTDTTPSDRVPRDKERKDARAQFFSTLYFTGAQPPKDFSVHLTEYEGIEHTNQYN